MATVSEILNAAADLLEKPGAWVQGWLAGDEYGRPQRTMVTGADFCAKCWCVFGAIQKAGWLAARSEEKAVGYKGIVSYHRKYPEMGMSVAKTLGLGTVSELMAWNDAPGRTQAEVVAALRAAATHQTGEPG